MHRLRLVASAFALFLAACGGNTQPESRPSAATSSTGSTSSTVTGIIGTGSGSGAGGGPSAPPITDFNMTETGGFKLGQPLTGSGVVDTGLNGTSGCGVVVGVVRDFKGKNEGGHADFESYGGSDSPTFNLVASALGTDSKPVYASNCEAAGMTAACPWGAQTSGKTNFDQWYRFTDGVNKPYLLYFLFKAVGNVATFDSKHFFPVDGAGFGGLAYADDFKQHNFAFTTELHTKFKYNGGETFQFEGDDDLWVFINGKLAIDLGGLHPPAKGTINLDASAATYGLTKGNVYLLELFHAERHTTASHFKVDTTLTFVDCGIIPPDVH